MPDQLGQRVISDVLGVKVQAKHGGLEVTAASAGGSWTAARLRPGDIIVAVDGARVADAASLGRVLGAARSRHRSTAWFTVVRAPYQGSVEVGI
jgi:C-terminal processing protease CtpA/Prc